MLLLGCRKVPNIQYDVLELEEIQELEVQERGVDVITFRMHVEDILLKTYFLHLRHYGAEGASSVFKMIITML